MIGSRDVKKLRKLIGLSREDFAAELGVDLESVEKWEQQRRRPSRLERRKLFKLDMDATGGVVFRR